MCIAPVSSINLSAKYWILVCIRSGDGGGDGVSGSGNSAILLLPLRFHSYSSYAINNNIFSFGGDHYFKSTVSKHTGTHSHTHTHKYRLMPFHVRDLNNLCIARYDYIKWCDCPSYHRFIIYIDSWTWNLRSPRCMKYAGSKSERENIRDNVESCSRHISICQKLKLLYISFDTHVWRIHTIEYANKYKNTRTDSFVIVISWCACLSMPLYTVLLCWLPIVFSW